MSSESNPPPPSNKHALETLRTLLNLPREVIDQFEPRRPPKHIEQYVARAPKREVQWLLVDVLHRLRTHPDSQPPGDHRLNGNNHPPED